MKFIGVENIIDAELLNLRKNRENQSIKLFNAIVNSKKTIEDFFEWFYVEHNAYNCLDYIKDTETDKIKGSY